MENEHLSSSNKNKQRLLESIEDSKKYGLDQNSILEKYVSGLIKFTPISNILSIEKKFSFENIGEHILREFGDDFTQELKIFKKVDNGLVAILFITTYLDYNILSNLFGTPIFHNEFGEGFLFEDGYPEQFKEWQYASYFVEINNKLFHIGFDHRGTRIEVECNSSAEIVVNSIKEIINRLV